MPINFAHYYNLLRSVEYPIYHNRDSNLIGTLKENDANATSK